jgi:hypothetical protein
VYVYGNSHTNTIESFWSLVTRGIDGVYYHVSSKYLQNYINECAFRYNHHKDTTPKFRSFFHRADLLGLTNLTQGLFKIRACKYVIVFIMNRVEPKVDFV